MSSKDDDELNMKEPEEILFNPSKYQENYFYGINDSEFLKDTIFKVKFNLESSIDKFLSNCNFREIPSINNYENIGNEWETIFFGISDFEEDNKNAKENITLFYGSKSYTPINLIKARRAYYYCIKEILEGAINYYKNSRHYSSSFKKRRNLEEIKNKKNLFKIKKIKTAKIRKSEYFYQLSKELDNLKQTFLKDTDWFETYERSFNLSSPIRLKLVKKKEKEEKEDNPNFNGH